MGGSALSLRRDHVWRTHHGRLGQTFMHYIFRRVKVFRNLLCILECIRVSFLKVARLTIGLGLCHLDPNCQPLRFTFSSLVLSFLSYRYMQPDLVDGELYLAPNFPAPPNTDYQGYHNYIDEMMPPESPYLYGLHPNAEIGFLTTTSENLFRTVFEMQPRSALDLVFRKLPTQLDSLNFPETLVHRAARQ
jgi:hypothetical protein